MTIVDATVVYEGAHVPSLTGVSLAIREGDFVGLVGRSGCGKSTLLRLIAGLIRPIRGTVTWDETVGRNGRPSIAFLEQGPSLLPGTIEENIRIARPDASEQAVIDAAKRAGCHDFVVALPRAYKSRVENIDNAAFSGGQLQRICLARTFLSDSRVILFDEPTAGLDIHAVAYFMESIQLLRAEGRAIVFVTHQLPLVSSATKVIGVANGRIVSEGTYTQCREWFHADNLDD